jgi:hypothetical protein
MGKLAKSGVNQALKSIKESLKVPALNLATLKHVKEYANQESTTLY